ncbi:DUF3389 domain-containing protein [Vibrio aquaticus]|uniref:DUF3389 domain-containing protein n=1 Tax=Vibrio aquaticus TaxID=2496559 RepID=A0A3S0MQ43_9VIBR|nr:DUF3389 domain-containing protein [Vibrio aquaticus]RTZ17343.1 DUF3389 domain-containing protein [Vibrio aquaticus]
MVIHFSNGKIIATPHEVVIKLEGNAMVTLQAQVDAITLIGRGANVIAANGVETKWSVKLDNQEQLEQLSQHASIAIQ